MTDQNLNVGNKWHQVTVTSLVGSFQTLAALLKTAGYILPFKSNVLQITLTPVGALLIQDADNQVSTTLGAGVSKQFPTYNGLDNIMVKNATNVTVELILQQNPGKM